MGSMYNLEIHLFRGAHIRVSKEQKKTLVKAVSARNADRPNFGALLLFQS